jgi:competence protein ComEA
MNFARFLMILLACCLAVAMPPQKKDSTPAKTGAGAAAMLDINSATESELKQLNGIGDAYAAKIIAGRPYRAKNELVQKKIIPQATYDKIKDQIIARQSPAAKGKGAGKK